MTGGAYNLEFVVRTLDSWGLTDVLLPFLLIFTIFFAIFQKSKILGENRRNMNVGISLVISLLVIVPHVLHAYPQGADVIDIMNKALPNVSIVVVAVIMLLVLLGIFGGEAKLVGMKMGNWVAIISLILIVWIFGAAAGWWGASSTWWTWLRNDVIAIIIILLVFGLIIAFVTAEDGSENSAGYMKRLGEDMKGIFGKE